MQEQNNTEKSNSDNTQITSDGVSMPVLNSNENAWPPPNIRQEVAESAQEDATQHQQGQPQQTGYMSTTAHSDDSQITSDGTSMPIASNNENAWPPPNIREEVIESAKHEETTHQQDQA
ncbi:MAG: hypothetical protein NVSMB49_09710 [Ktedonobacteraceae bacterium]